MNDSEVQHMNNNTEGKDRCHAEGGRHRFTSTIFYRVMLRCLLGVVIAIVLLYLYLLITA